MMTQRKVALVGTADGPWINIRNMEPLSVKVDMPTGVEISVFITQGQNQSDTGMFRSITKPGEHELDCGVWAKISVTKGDPAAVLCTFYSRQEVPCLTAK